MTALEYLSRPREIMDRISARNEKILTLRTVAEKTTTTLHPAGVGGSGEEHKMDNFMAKIEELENENRKDSREFAAVCIEISDTLDRLDNENHRRILRMWSLEMNSFPEIAEELGICLRSIYYLKKQAFRKLDTALMHLSPQTAGV